MARPVFLFLLLPFLSSLAEQDITLGISALTLATPDLQASGAFYEALGFKNTYSGLLPPWKTYAIGNKQALNLQGVNATDPFVASGSPVWGRPVIYVSSVDLIYERAVAAGYKPEMPPSNADWGERYFHIKDPAGHEIAFARPLHGDKDPESHDSSTQTTPQEQ